ncbi:MAG: tripartite tricarboxylate transporter substrate binding protein [Variibacter sp.]|nr:tripartite tricarboxylate transporter substrate binding protein [Variibacter sp.]
MNAIRGIVAAFAVLLAADPGLAQTKYPEKPVRIIVGFTAGSATDITGRIFAQKFSEAWGVPVTVENIPGSSGAIGVDRVAKAEPDGYTLMWTGNGAVTIVPSLQGAPYDPARDLAPITAALVMPSILAVHNDLPAKTLQELIALAKKEPGKLTYATPGVGTPQHIAGELLKRLAGIDIVHVPYRGAQLTDVLGGRVPITLQNVGAMLPVVREGKLRGVAVTSLKRSQQLPDLPTIAESGFPGFEAISWFGLLAPAGTPQAIIAKVREEALKVLADAKTRERFDQLGLETVGNTPAEMAASIKSDLEKWAKLIKEAGIKASN